MILPALDDTATDPETLRFLFETLAYVHTHAPGQNMLVIEAGTYHGHFSATLAANLPNATVWTADTTRSPHLPTLPNLMFYQGDFEDMLNKLQPESVDFAFIDSGPPMPVPEEGIRLRHWRAAKPYMRSGGLMVSHDANATDWYGSLQIRNDGIHLAGGRGIVLWQKP